MSEISPESNKEGGNKKTPKSSETQIRENVSMDNNPNSLSNQQSNSNQEQEQPQPGLFSKFKKFFIIFIGFQIVSALFGSKMKNSISFQNVFDDNTEFNVDFYIEQSRFPSDYETIINKYRPIWSVENVKYSSTGNDTLIENEIEYDLDLNKLSEKSLDKEGLFLYAGINLSNKKENSRIRRLFKQDFENSKILFESTNLLKFSENLKETIRSVDLMNDLEGTSFKDSSSTEFTESSTDSTTTSDSKIYKQAIPNLYYKPEVYLYIASMDNNQDVSVFQEMNLMGIKPTLYRIEKLFLPFAYLTDFWTMLSDLKPVEKTLMEITSTNKSEENISKIKVKINFKFLSMFYFKFLRGIEMNSEMMEKNMHVPASKDLFVELLKNNSAIYLTIMLVVNVLHSVFSFLGFASDISYYKNLKQLDGLYTKHLFFHLFHLAITFLYVYIEGANFIVKIELFVALAIEIWKFRKIFKLEILKKFPFISIKYKITFSKTKSKNYETEAVSLMMKYLFGPVAVLYLSYRVYYYKNLLSLSIFKFAIEYIFFLMNLFGFILLTPQIYLNYKLKSVKHLPLKALTFKFLNTIIDDLYAFAVKTPTLYRVFCFKDDLIFVIYIIQIFLYRGNKREEIDEEQAEANEEGREETKNLDMNGQEMLENEKHKESIFSTAKESDNPIQNQEKETQNNK